MPHVNLSGSERVLATHVCTRQENLEAILHSLSERGVLYDLIDGVFRYCDESGILPPDEEAAIDTIRPGLTEYLRRERALCIVCGVKPANRPDYGPKVRKRIAPAFCNACWDAGAWGR